MKKILLSVVVTVIGLSTISYSCNESSARKTSDTEIEISLPHNSNAVVVNLTMQAQDWAWLIGKNERRINIDSTSSSNFRLIRDAIRALTIPNWTTNVTINNIPDNIAINFYKTVKTSNSGEIAHRYTAITNEIGGKAALSAELTAYDLNFVGTDSSDFERFRRIGKNIVMDN